MTDASRTAITISAHGPQADDTLRQAHTELRRAGHRVELSTDAAPAGSKGGTGVALASLVLTGLCTAAGVRSVSQVLVAVVKRSDKRRTELRCGESVCVLEGGSVSDQRAALQAWLTLHASAGTACTGAEETKQLVAQEEEA